VNFLLDTNAISEFTKPAPDPGLVGWLASIDEDRVYLSVITLAELRHGVERLVPGRRRTRLEAWLEHELPERFAGRVLHIDIPIAHAWGRLVAGAQAAGKSIGSMDAFIAATVQTAGLVLVTRNVREFAATGVPIHNPWAN
jgi:predicted nucleic acid-binding protein